MYIYVTLRHVIFNSCFRFPLTNDSRRFDPVRHLYLLSKERAFRIHELAHIITNRTARMNTCQQLHYLNISTAIVSFILLVSFVLSFNLKIALVGGRA